VSETFITCSSCGKKIQLTEAITQQIENKLRKEFDHEVKKKEKDFENIIKDKEKELEEKLHQEKVKLDKQAKKRAEEALSIEMKDLKEQLDEKAKLLEGAYKQELALRKRTRELEVKEKSLELDVQRTLDKEREKIRQAAQLEFQEERQLKDAEKDQQLAEMRKQIEELKRKAEQGSQQTQGEVLELELEDILRSNFRSDEVQAVAKGLKGGDILQKVYTKSGHYCGEILWEAKRTKTWSDGWIQKLKDDQRAVRADLCALVSTVLPKDVRRIGNVEDVWVTDFASIVGIGTALREILIKVTQARSALSGKTDKMEVIYNYLTGSEFRQRIEAILEPFITMKDDLDTERRAMEKAWAKREKKIQRVMQSIAGMHGDLQGIVGIALPQIKFIEFSEDSNSTLEGDLNNGPTPE
jgi:hypothetical protein